MSTMMVKAAGAIVAVCVGVNETPSAPEWWTEGIRQAWFFALVVGAIVFLYRTIFKDEIAKGRDYKISELKERHAISTADAKSTAALASAMDEAALALRTLNTISEKLETVTENIEHLCPVAAGRVAVSAVDLTAPATRPGR